MRSGTYGKGNTKFEKLTVKRFPITIWDSYLYGKAGCGATALGLITGISPLEIAKRHNSAHYSDNFMIKFLRKYGISVYEVNRANISNKSVWKHSLRDDHVLLYSALIQKKEASWFVAGPNSVIFHNGEIMKASYLDFINFPIESMFVLYRKEWAI